MNVNARKNQKLIRQYWFLQDILSARMEPYDGNNCIRIDDLTIRVEIADGDLMYRRADNIGLGDGSFSINLKGREGQVMRRGEYIFAIGKNGQIINRMDWPRNNDERRGVQRNVYGGLVLWANRHSDGSCTDCLYEATKYLVWVTVTAWHKDTKEDNPPGSRFGEFCDRSISVTIYREPKCGFGKLQRESCPQENLCLDSHTLERAYFEKDLDILIIGGRLDELCQLFQDKVYFNGMKDVLDSGKCRGASGNTGSLKVLCAEMCGYDRVMLQQGSTWISLQLRPGAKSMYVLGVGGTLPQVRQLVRSVDEVWNQGSKPLRREFKPDKEVSVI